ncbi:MAG TPA: S8 family serine peptidase, partial [Candidatus Sulfomarinibacteraceae bacterium]|nr:S8 family serine peptidase [Candidatus Sulfomarinibacteraceae bacterium]
MKGKKKLHPIGTLIGSFVIVLVLVFAVANLRASTAAAAEGDTGPFTVLKAGEIDEAALAGLEAGWRAEKDGERAIYLIRLASEPVATYQGGLPELPATSPSATGQRAVDLESNAVQMYRQHLKSERASFVDSAQSLLGRNLDVVYEYEMANNGMAVWLTAKEAAQVATLPGVEFIQKDEERELHTDNGPAWIGAEGIWDGSNTGGLASTMGEGVVVGVIDTGINYGNESFAEVGPVDGYVHQNPLGTGSFIGLCADDPDYAHYCNDKLIGVRGYATVNDGDPVDYNGHGSHTASTAAGNIVTATIEAPTTTVTRTISGVAPHANIIAYNACCTLSALSAAIDDIVSDYATIQAADEDARMVVNYSIGSTSPSDVWNDFDTVGYLAARDAGIFVATSAGNSGPGANTVGSPADAPWLTSVAASTHNRTYSNTVSFDGGASSLAPITGRSITDGLAETEIVFAGDVDGDGQCLDPFPAGTWNGEIVVCIRGEIARVDKGWNVLQGGAGGLILANDQANGDSLNADPHYLPAVHITYDDGQALLDWLEVGDGHMAEISGSEIDEDDANGDIMAAFSSRGANRALGDIIAPHVAAPGVDILAAYGTDNAEEWSMISGTSMASPHVAGAAALLMALHPDWTPAEVQSALMTTAWTDVLKEDATTPADPFDMGSGRVDLNVAAQAGLVLGETITNYVNANPTIGGDPSTLNLPSMAQDECLVECSWTREVRSTSPAALMWSTSASGDGDLSLTVEPASFTLLSGETQLITVTADVSALDYGEWVFGEVTLSPSIAPVDAPDATEGVLTTPDAHFPVAVKSTPVMNLPDVVAVYGADETGTEPVEGVQAIASDDLTAMPYGLEQAFLFETYINQDPTNGEPFDMLGAPGYGTYVVVATIGEDGARRLVSEIVDTTSFDLDMFVYHVDTGTFYCIAQTASAYEYCSVADPAPGTYWIIIQNWAGSTYFEDTWPGPDEPHLFDRVEFTAAIVDDDNDNLTVTPDKTNVATGESFDLDVDWDLSASAPGTYWYGLFDLIGGTGGSDVELGTVDVDIHRAPYTVDGEGDFIFPGTAGTTVTIDVPEGALGAGEWLAYEPHNVVRAGSDGLHARGFGFELVPYDADGYNPGFDFNGESVTVTIDYSASPALEANAA